MKVSSGTMPCVFANGSDGLMSGLCVLDISPAGRGIDRALRIVESGVVDYSVGRIVFSKWIATLRPGEFVFVVAT